MVLPRDESEIGVLADARRERRRDPAEVAQSYELADADTGRILSKHRTKRAAIDAFTTGHGRPVKLFRMYSSGELRLLAEGVWYRGDGIPVPVTRRSPDL